MSTTMSEHEFRDRFADAEDRAVLGYPHVDDAEAIRVLADEAMLHATYDSWVLAQHEQPPQPGPGALDESAYPSMYGSSSPTSPTSSSPYGGPGSPAFDDQQPIDKAPIGAEASSGYGSSGYFEGQASRGFGVGGMYAGRPYGGGRNTVVVALVLGLVGCVLGPFVFAGGIILGSWGLRRALAVPRTETRRALVTWSIVASSASLVIAFGGLALRLAGSGLFG